MTHAPDAGDAAAAALRLALNGVPSEQVVVLCVGNPERGDDGYGPAVAARLVGRVRSRVFDCGTTPENDLPAAAECAPRVALFVDAVHVGEPPGTMALFSPDDLRSDDFSTHAGSLGIAAEFLREACGARVLLLAAQPAQCELHGELGPQMRAAVEDTAELLSDLLGGQASSEVT